MPRLFIFLCHNKFLSQFRERYKGYKISLATLRTGRLYSKLGLNPDGTKAVPKAQPRTPSTLLGSLELEGSTPAERAAALTAALESEASEDIAATPTGRRPGRPPKVAREASDDDEAEEQEEEEEEVEADVGLASKFIDLVDVLPPLPKKGEFDVNTIKKSLYFFS